MLAEGVRAMADNSDRTDIEWKRKDCREHMNVCRLAGVTYLTFPILERTGIVRHGFSTRLGGVSEGIFSSMNLSFSRGDDEERVQENYRRMAQALGSDTTHMVLSQQTHTTNVRIVTGQDRGKGIHTPLDYTDVDGMVTEESGIMLVTFYADCVPIYLVDVKHHAIGLSHSGWRGTVGRMGSRTLDVMRERYHTEPRDVVAAIGPSICRDCYEVSEDVIWEFEKAFGEERMPALAYKKTNGKYQLDLWSANRMVLEDAGVLGEHIQTTDICTCCNPELLFSHRASEGKRGNLAAFLELL